MNGSIFGDVTSANLPILILIATGFAARRFLLPNREIWAGLDRLNFRVLVPAMIVSALSSADIYAIADFDILLSIAITLAAVILFLFASRSLFVPKHTSVAGFTSLFQTSIRWNASIALVVAEFVFAPTAVATIALLMVFIIPAVNIINVVIMLRLLSTEAVSLRKILTALIGNPILIGCVIGLLISTVQLPLPTSVVTSLDLLTDACLATILLSIGAGLNRASITGQPLPLFMSCAIKLVLTPALFLAVGWYLKIDSSLLAVATVAVAMPSATNGYALAQEMGGDAPLYASICTTQTLLSLCTVPIWILICIQLF